MRRSSCLLAFVVAAGFLAARPAAACSFMTVTVDFVLQKDIPAPAGAALAPAVPK